MNNFSRILFGVVAATSASFTSAAVLVDSSNITTGTANGFSGANTSAIASPNTTFGFSSNSLSGTAQLADDFAVAQQVDVSNVTVYAYSTSTYANPPPSPFTGATVSIWSAQPGSPGATILSTSTTFTTSWTGVYRVTSTTLTNAQRPVMALKASFPSVTLPAGSYWVSWGITGVVAPGSTASVFTPPRMNTDGSMPAGNAVQSTDGGLTWLAISDTTTLATSELPFLVEGTGVPPVQTATTTSLSGSPNPTTLGNGITLTATVTGNSPTGTVQFLAGSSVISACGSVALSSGAAACVVPAASLHVGANAFSATYSGDAANLGSSGNFTETVNKATAVATLGSICQTTFTAGEPFTFAATVTGQSPTGTVSFLVNSGPVTGCSTVAISGGAASCTASDLPQGTLSLTANYSGDANNTSANSAALQVTVLDPSEVIFRDNFETVSENCPIE